MISSHAPECTGTLLQTRTGLSTAGGHTNPCPPSLDNDLFIPRAQAGNHSSPPPAVYRKFLVILYQLLLSYFNCLTSLLIYYSFFTNNARTAFSTASTITPTSAKIASHILAIPTAARTRHNTLTPIAK